MGYKSSLFPSGITDLEDLFVSDPSIIDDFKNVENGNLWGFGKGLSGNLGDGEQINRSSPVQTLAGGSWKEMTGFSKANPSGSDPVFIGAIKTNGTLWTWGDSFLGANGAVPRSSPVQLGTRTDWAKISSGAGQTIHAITLTGQLFGWGKNDDGSVGDGTRIIRSSPVQIGSNSNWKEIAHGHGIHSPVLAIKTNGTLWGWGSNSYSKLGLGVNGVPDEIDRSSPVQIGTDTKWKKISAGTMNGAAIKTDNSLWIWGYNKSGVLGNNIDEFVVGAYYSPTQVQWSDSANNRWKSVAVGGFPTTLLNDGNPYIIAVDNNGYLWAVGYIRSLVGSSDERRSSPVQLTSFGNGWEKIETNCGTYVGLKTNGTMWFWGKHEIPETFGLSTPGDGLSSPVQIFSNGKNNWKKIMLTRPPESYQWNSGNIFSIES